MGTPYFFRIFDPPEACPWEPLIFWGHYITLYYIILHYICHGHGHGTIINTWARRPGHATHVLKTVAYSRSQFQLR